MPNFSAFVSRNPAGQTVAVQCWAGYPTLHQAVVSKLTELLRSCVSATYPGDQVDQAQQWVAASLKS